MLGPLPVNGVGGREPDGSGQEPSAVSAAHDGAGRRGRGEPPAPPVGHEVVEPVGELGWHEACNRGEPARDAARPPEALENRRGPHEQAAVGRPQHEAVGQRPARSVAHERAERLAPEGREAKGPVAVEPQEQADREVAQAAGAVVEEDVGRQGASARSAATRASMLATVVSPSRR